MVGKMRECVGAQLRVLIVPVAIRKIAYGRMEDRRREGWSLRDRRHDIVGRILNTEYLV